MPRSGPKQQRIDAPASMPLIYGPDASAARRSGLAGGGGVLSSFTRTPPPQRRSRQPKVDMRARGVPKCNDEEPDMLFVPKNTPPGPPDGGLVGVSTPNDDPVTTIDRCAPSCVVTGPAHTPCGSAHAGRISLLEATNRLDWMRPTLRFGYGSSSPRRSLRSGLWGCLRPDACTPNGSASLRQGVALDPARSLRAPLQTMVKGAFELPFKPHDRGDLALLWPPSTALAQGPRRRHCRPLQPRQGTGLRRGRTSA